LGRLGKDGWRPQIANTANAEEFDISYRFIVLLKMIPLFLSLLSRDDHILLLSAWVDVRSLGTLDVAVSCNASRPYWLMLLHSLRGGIIDDWGHSISSLMWLTRRGIHATRVQMQLQKDYADAGRVNGCDLLLLETDNIVHLGLNCCCNLTDQCIMDMANQCSKLTSIDLNGCR
jgi:hypothetical protein